MTLSAAQARSLIDAGKAKAAELGVAVNLAVLDAGGRLKAFERMDGAPLGAIDIAQKKALTAVLFGLNSEAVGAFCAPGGPAPGLDSTNGGLVVFAGGIPLRDGAGALVGSVGVSGAAVDQDFAVASAAAEAFQH